MHSNIVLILAFNLIMNLQELRFPIGEHVYKTVASRQELQDAIAVLENFPAWIEKRIENLDAAQLATAYRPGGWTIAQVVHHCADSHMNCLIRLKLALTEDCPTIKPYDETAWALQMDYDLPINNSTTILHAVHRKLIIIFQNLLQADWQKTYIHPQHDNKTFNVVELLMLYSWHCKHHFAHINNLCKEKGW
jgi:hypothetical protein